MEREVWVRVVGISLGGTALIWAVAWGIALAPYNIAPAIPLVQWLAAITAVQILTLYLLSGDRGKRLLVLCAAALALIAVAGGLASLQLSSGSEAVSRGIRDLTGFFIFPAGALAIGLAVAIALDLIGVGLRPLRQTGSDR